MIEFGKNRDGASGIKLASLECRRRVARHRRRDELFDRDPLERDPQERGAVGDYDEAFPK